MNLKVDVMMDKAYRLAFGHYANETRKSLEFLSKGFQYDLKRHTFGSKSWYNLQKEPTMATPLPKLVTMIKTKKGGVRVCLQ